MKGFRKKAPVRKKRSYDATSRRAKARETRDRMIESARALFASRGYGATSIEDIAARARVSPQTFYAVFASKRGVLEPMLDAMDADAGVPALLDAIAASAGDPPRQIALIVDFSARFYNRNADLIGIVRAAGETEPDLAALKDEGENRRRLAQRPLVAAWERRGALRLPSAEALDLFWTMTTSDWFDLLVGACGWPVERYRKELTGALVRLLLK